MIPPRKPLFTVSNHHIPDDVPPSVDGDDPNTYHSYFENRYGEQSVFVFRWDTEEAILYSGDAGWGAHPIFDGKLDILLSPEEAMWLRACFKAIGRPVS